MPADLSFLDLTTVREGQGLRGEDAGIHHVGLVLASTDPVALDTVAAHATGYEDLPIWTTIHGHRLGLGESDPAKITLHGLNWESIEKRRLKYPLLAPAVKKSIYDRASNFANHTFLRPRPVISSNECTGCGDCADRCPVRSIERTEGNVFRIDLNRCGDCGCCTQVCEYGAIDLEHVGLARIARRVTGFKPELAA